jgi:hypothetical protein
MARHRYAPAAALATNEPPPEAASPGSEDAGSAFSRLKLGLDWLSPKEPLIDFIDQIGFLLRRPPRRPSSPCWCARFRAFNRFAAVCRSLAISGPPSIDI